MNEAALKGFRQIGSMGFDFGPKLTVTKTADGWEARKDGKLLGVTATREGVKELLGAL